MMGKKEDNTENVKQRITDFVESLKDDVNAVMAIAICKEDEDGHTLCCMTMPSDEEGAMAIIEAFMSSPIIEPYVNEYLKQLAQKKPIDIWKAEEEAEDIINEIFKTKDNGLENQLS